MNRKGDICLACRRGRLKIAGKTCRGAQVYACSGCGHRVVEELR